MKFRVSDGARFFLLGQRKTIFVEPAQQIFEVDDLTAYLTCNLVEALSFQEMVSDLVGRGLARGPANAFVKKYLRSWSRQGLLDVVLDENDGQPIHTHVLDLATTAAAIAYYDRSVRDLFLPVFDHLARPGAQAALAYDVARFGDCGCIRRNGSRGMIVTSAEAVPALKGFLTEDALGAVGTDVALHGALLVKNARSLLICGAPGAGKTTLALALVAAGFDCGGDDIALMDGRGLMRGVPFAPALKSGSWDLLDGLRDAIIACPVHRRLDNKRVRYLAPVRYAPREHVPLHMIVLIRRRKEGPAVISAVEPVQALSELLSGAFTSERRLDVMQFESLLTAVSGARLVELTFSRLDEAVAILSRYHEEG
ncbi:serine kinase [Sinorhizobium mexicanum]|uniref:Serine kinase n=2 Tax=Sinorhizobium mexicanum TaxID=375549 RepID=A0A859QEC0_9HYPH|nr:serine kinase [Sinorhizobium mexicanum]